MTTPDGMGSLDAGDISHGLLLALLQQHHQGKAVLLIASLEAAMGDTEGRMWSVMTSPIEGRPDLIQLQVVHVSRDETGAH